MHNIDTDVLKNITRRTSQLGLIALAVSSGVALYYLLLGLTVSAVMVGCFAVTVTVLLILQYFKILKEAQIFILTSICILLVVSSFVEGANTGQYFYFFSVVVVIPILIDYKHSSNRELCVTYVAVVSSFAVCFYVGHTFKPIENIAPAVAEKMLFNNAGAAILLTLCFSLAYIHYEKKHLKAILTEKNNAIAARTKFLSTMGHELRTPLNGIIGALNIIQDEEQEFCSNEYFPILKYCSNHMQNLINDILDFSKIEADKLSIHPIEGNLKQLLINSTLPFYNHIEEKGLQLIVEIDPALDTLVLVDDVRLIQILNNLLSNAMKFTEKGFIKLSARCLQTEASAINVSFTVEDSGIGISKEHQDTIFESFGQVFNEGSRKYSGTGLGLTISLRLLQLMGSKLKLMSGSSGSTFSFDLVLTRKSSGSQHSNQNFIETSDLAGIRILLVEDNQINMMIAKKMLTAKNAVCSCAFNGLEALDILAADAGFNIILLDLEMPVMDGHTAILKIKEMYPEIPVVALTASLVDQEKVASLLASGFDDCILKPFQPQHLFTQVRKYSNTSAKVKAELPVLTA